MGVKLLRWCNEYFYDKFGVYEHLELRWSAGYTDVI